MALDLVFHFHFYDRTNDVRPLRSLAFYIANLLTINTYQDWEIMEWEIISIGQKMNEKYGKHNGKFSAASPSSLFFNAALLCLNSTDIEEPHHNQVMHAWRAAFLHDFVGCEVSEVFDITHLKDEARIFSHVKQAYEHQQAQQLRDTLNTHVGVVQSKTPSKKL